MANIDLSSKEWRDLVFEGKNKEFGAYQLRAASEHRHTIALICTIAGLIIIGLLFWAKSLYDQKQAEEALARALAEARVEQEQFVEAEIEEEEPEENQMEMEEPEIPEALPEEILNTEKFTEFVVDKDENITEEVKSNEEIRETETAIGNTNFDQGTDDLNVVREHKDEIIVEEKKPVVQDKPFESVEQMPQFPGGEAELQKWVASHIQYPPVAMENGIQGRVVVRFVVKQDGSIGDVQVVRGKDPDLDKEARRVVKALPKFIPGKMNGQNVSVWFTLPINFKLAGQ